MTQPGNRNFRRRKNALMRGPTARLTIRELNDLIRRRGKPAVRRPPPEMTKPDEGDVH